jgi:transposase
MLTVPARIRIFLCLPVTDLRKSFDGLAALVQEAFGGDPLSGHWFVFRNRRGDRLKLLYWDEDGFVLFYKRLEEGVFHFPTAVDAAVASLEIRAADLTMLLDGVDLESVRRRRRYRRPTSA